MLHKVTVTVTVFTCVVTQVAILIILHVHKGVAKPGPAVLLPGRASQYKCSPGQ